MSGRLRIFDPSEVFPDYAAGVLAVVKDLDRDRLILDARPCNLRETSLNVWCKTLASAHAVSLIELDEDRVLLRSGQDLRDYFYQFRVSRRRAARNILKGGLSRDELLRIFDGDLGDFKGDYKGSLPADEELPGGEILDVHPLWEPPTSTAHQSNRT